MSEIVVTGRATDLIGIAGSASEGVVGRIDLEDRPIQRIAELLETVPGFIATQHSGGGKANQYFLRGFNLDHGTDFAVFHDGVPLNMRTHGHGQGYLDLNFIIPELIDTLTFAKGPYHAENGDFATAGSGRFRTIDTLEAPFVKAEVGTSNFYRIVAAGSTKLGAGNLLLGVETRYDDGPFELPQDLKLVSGFAKWTGPLAGGTLRASATGYHVKFRSPEQVPLRAIESGLIDRLGFLDSDLGGETTRVGGVLSWIDDARGPLNILGYAHYYDFRLTSNFTYFLDDPVNGDEFEQIDERQLYGFTASQQWDVGRSRWRLGAEGRYDDIGQVGLFRTARRARLSTVRDDSVKEGSLGVFVANEFRFNEKLRSYVGVRRDQYRFEVDSSLAANSGEESAGITSYKASLAYQPIKPLELYASYGTGFHSNDARGTTITINPVDGEPADRVDPLVGSQGAELGSRIHFTDRLQATLAVWTLKLESELLFVGDAGTTEASRPSRRDGAEAGIYWFPNRRYSANLEVSYTRSRFADDDPVGNEIPGSIPLVVSSGISAHYDNGWLASAQLKHFGKYPLIEDNNEDNNVESAGSTIVNLRLGREWNKVGVYLDVLNLLDSNDHDVDYFYASRLQGERDAGIEDIHYHVFPPRSLRLSLRYMF